MMKTRNPLLVCVVGLVGGCATTSQLDNANIQIGALESRIARIEKGLYRVEVKSAPKQVVEPKFVPATEVEQNVIDTRIDAFLKEYLGAQFGDSIDLYPTPVDDSTKWERNRRRFIPVQKSFGYLDKAIGYFDDGKLYKIDFLAEIENKYSIDSVNERIKQSLADMAVSFGLASDAFKSRNWRLGAPHSSYTLSQYNWGSYDVSVPKGFKRYGAEIENAKLRRKLEADRISRSRAQGEQLPEKKPCAEVHSPQR